MTTDRPAEGLSIARRLDFAGPQPNYFGVAPADARPLAAGTFVGDVAAGGSCNANVLTLTPHCHGTHTEGIGHVTAPPPDVLDRIPRRPLAALVVSVPERRAADVDESLPPSATGTDRVLAAHDLAPALAAAAGIEALVIRTLPNPPEKAYAQYTDSAHYPYLTMDGVAAIVDAGVEHLLIDTPSLDRLDDGGALAVHRAFWGLAPGELDAARARRPDATVTEMIYVPETIEDGRYRLLIQPAPFAGDATPSNPLLFREREEG